MKKIFSALLIVLLAASVSYGAWSYTAETQKRYTLSNGLKMYRVKLRAESDGTNGEEIILSTKLATPTEGDTIKPYEGARLVQVEIDPFRAPDNTYGILIKSDTGANLFNLSGLSTTETELVVASAGEGSIVQDVKIDFDDIGSNKDVVDLYLYFVK